MLTYHKTTEDEKYAITAWNYTGDYAIYNSTPYEEQKQAQRGFANPENNFYSFCDCETLVGFVNLSEEPTEVFFGIGVRPDWLRPGLRPADDKDRAGALPQPLSGQAPVSRGADVEHARGALL